MICLNSASGWGRGHPEIWSFIIFSVFVSFELLGNKLLGLERGEDPPDGCVRCYWNKLRETHGFEVCRLESFFFG